MAELMWFVQVDTRAAMLLTFELGRLLGFEDCNNLGSEEQDILRLLTPLAKLYTAKQVSVSSVSVWAHLLHAGQFYTMTPKTAPPP